MKRVTAIMGSPRAGETYKVVRLFEAYLKRLGDVELDYVFLKDKNLGFCKGCGLCLYKGEEFCPIKDDRAEIFEKIMSSDGIIMAAPVYSLQVPAYMKNFLDRMAYVFHRPCFFHKAFISIVTQGVYGDRGTIKYLDEVAAFWGFKRCKGVGLTTLGEMLPEQIQAIEKKIAEGAREFYRVLSEPTPTPSLKELMIFRWVRATKPYIAKETPRDYEYFRDQGWLESDYYYPVRLGAVKKCIGYVFDRIGAFQGRKIERDKSRLVQLNYYEG